MDKRRTLLGRVDARALAFTAGSDIHLDMLLAEADCIGTAAHVTMLSRIDSAPPVSPHHRDRIVRELVSIIRSVREKRFKIRKTDQDVHLAVERVLTQKLGDAGKRVHTGRSRNDQIAVDLRLYGKQQLLDVMGLVHELSQTLVKIASKNKAVPMVGRTHQQRAMPSSVGLWASSHAESLLDDHIVLEAAYAVNDRCPLGSGAGFGVPLAIDRHLTSRLLGFREPHVNVLYAANGRGKCESVILSSLSQVMLTLSRLAQDLILYSIPELGYFTLPDEFCTGSSIMPQKRNPDVVELTRARATVVIGYASTVSTIVGSLSGGYHRDLQETKGPFLDGLRITRECLEILTMFLPGIRINRRKLIESFSPEVFATDRALEKVSRGKAFRDAYKEVKNDPETILSDDPVEALRKKEHYGAPANLDFSEFRRRIRERARFVSAERKKFHSAVTRLLGVRYPDL
jgi:argininosuccinate lyase